MFQVHQIVTRLKVHAVLTQPELVVLIRELWTQLEALQTRYDALEEKCNAQCEQPVATEVKDKPAPTPKPKPKSKATKPTT